jgi:hypothetical protein
MGSVCPPRWQFPHMSPAGGGQGVDFYGNPFNSLCAPRNCKS